MINVSIFPETDAETGLIATKRIEIVGKQAVWVDLDSFNIPTQPATPEAPMAAGASFLVSSLVGTLLVASSLF